MNGPLGEVIDAYRLGNYESALEKCEGLKRGGKNTAPYCFMRGGMLLQLGSLIEGEVSLREGLALEEWPRSQALVLSQLGVAMLDQARFDDAIAFFEESIKAYPRRGGSHRGIAEVHLRQGRKLLEALERARKSVAIERGDNSLGAQNKNTNLSEALGVLAWAVAATSRDVSEAHSTLDEAFHLCGNKNLPMRAKLHYHAARAYDALRNEERTKFHLQEASKFDPQGTFGRLARERLAA